MGQWEVLKSCFLLFQVEEGVLTLYLCLNFFKKRLFWLQYEEHLEEGENGSGKSRERLQQSRQEIMNGTLEWSSGGD